MQRNPVILVGNPGVQLTNAYASYYTVPANTTTTISAFDLNNTTAGAITVSVSIVPSGESQGAANEILTDVSIGAKTRLTVNLAGHHMAAGAAIQMKASAGASITPRVSGYAVVA